MKKILLIILITYSFTYFSCATMYQPLSGTGGYSEVQLDENIFRVRFNGNGFTSGARSSDLCLLRSAELCKNYGFKYFMIIDASKDVSKSQFSTPKTTNTTGSATSIGNTVYGNSQSTTWGGQTYTISRPSNENTIICFFEKPNSGVSYNAEFLYNSMTKKYNIGKNKYTYSQPIKPKSNVPAGWDVPK